MTREAIMVESCGVGERRYQISVVEIEDGDWTILNVLHDSLLLGDTIYHAATVEAMVRGIEMLYGVRTDHGPGWEPLWRWHDDRDHCHECREYTEKMETIHILSE